MRLFASTPTAVIRKSRSIPATICPPPYQPAVHFRAGPTSGLPRASLSQDRSAHPKPKRADAPPSGGRTVMFSRRAPRWQTLFSVSLRKQRATATASCASRLPVAAMRLLARDPSGSTKKRASSVPLRCRLGPACGRSSALTPVAGSQAGLDARGVRKIFLVIALKCARLVLPYTSLVLRSLAARRPRSTRDERRVNTEGPRRGCGFPPAPTPPTAKHAAPPLALRR